MGQVPNDVLAVLRRAGLVDFAAEPDGAPLTGGVSSDIWRVDLPAGPVCVKRALAQLRVKADWRAPRERSGYEAAWFDVVGGVAPAAVPRLLFMDPAAGAVVMSFFPPDRYRLWKQVLRGGETDLATAADVGRCLGRIHAATAHRDDIAARFPTDTIFHDIRLEPYLIATGRAHPGLALALGRLARRTATTKLALVHGDVSPKNILLGPDGPVFLDAECAWYGDPAFDLAFCLNHLLLKCLWVPDAAGGFLACFDALLESYLLGAVWEPRRELEARAAALLPALFLARVDGKSPVEYVTAAADRERVRRLATAFLQTPSENITPIREAWAVELGL
jgi:aminoglycoside phosphotransferase (APT) family kinase protein